MRADVYIGETTILHDKIYDLPPILAAVYGGHVDLVRFLIEKGIDIHTRNRDGMNAMHLALLRDHDNDVQMLQLLREHRVPADIPADAMSIMVVKPRAQQTFVLKGLHPLHLAIVTGHGTSTADVIRQLMNDGLPLDMKDANGFSPMHVFAMSSCDNSIGDILVEH